MTCYYNTLTTLVVFTLVVFHWLAMIPLLLYSTWTVLQYTPCETNQVKPNIEEPYLGDPNAMSGPCDIRTRGDFRHEYEVSLAPGDEARVFEDVSVSLDVARQRLRDLRFRRVDVAKRRSEHLRKLSDWKGKIPRNLGAPIPSRESCFGTGMPCKAIATFAGPIRSWRGNRSRVGIVFRSKYVRALYGLDLFDKVWLLFTVSQDGYEEGAIFPRVKGQLGICENLGQQAGSNEKQVHLLLVSLLARCGRGSNSNDMIIVEAETPGTPLADIVHAHAAVIDVKPYLSYCEALAS